MQNVRIMWVNLTGEQGAPALCDRLGRHCCVSVCPDAGALPECMVQMKPDILCLDFAEPDAAGRVLVQRIRLDHPSIPVLLFTTARSVDLVIWAMRTRVWDCFIKPVSCGEVLRRLNLLFAVLPARTGQDSRTLLMPERGLAPRATGADHAPGAGRTAAALPFLHQRFHEKITLPQAARLCGMDSFEFSRCFRREQGVTFRDYLMRLRIETAARRLRRDSQSILDIACSVGVNDPSQFARLFRRHMGLTPRAYRNAPPTAALM